MNVTEGSVTVLFALLPFCCSELQNSPIRFANRSVYLREKASDEGNQLKPIMEKWTHASLVGSFDPIIPSINQMTG